MFIRFFRHDEESEVLVRVEDIWKIQVKYAVHLPDGTFFRTTLFEGMSNPSARRHYTLFIGDEKIKVASDPNDPVMQVIEDLYRNAVKSPEPVRKPME
ncbi:MAG TPA: hypothetical protein VM452_17065 [Caulifigura sp.]|jgi:hypothetical protein|nr:hypothetical protein [Caulifigura sp.]